MQVNVPPPHTGPKLDTERPDEGGTTDGGEEPPTSDLDDTALSTMSSVVSVDGEDDAGTIHRGRKRKPSVDLSNERNVTRKLYKTHMRSDRREQSSDQDESCQADGGSDVKKARLVKGHYKPGTSRSAKASRKLREETDNGTHVIDTNKLEAWKMKIRKIDSDVSFEEGNPRKVCHTRCARWILVKEPGDTTRFKEHLQTCTAKPIPVEGTLVGMGWLKKVEKDRGMKGSIEQKSTMPCRGVSELDNPLVSQYLNRTGTGGGGARSIHLISKAQFGTEYRNLTKGQKDEVDAVQRGEWVWRNDHLNELRSVYIESFPRCITLSQMQVLA